MQAADTDTDSDSDTRVSAADAVKTQLELRLRKSANRWERGGIGRGIRGVITGGPGHDNDENDAVKIKKFAFMTDGARTAETQLDSSQNIISDPCSLANSLSLSLSLSLSISV